MEYMSLNTAGVAGTDSSPASSSSFFFRPFFTSFLGPSFTAVLRLDPNSTAPYNITDIERNIDVLTKKSSGIHLNSAGKSQINDRLKYFFPSDYCIYDVDIPCQKNGDNA